MALDNIEKEDIQIATQELVRQNKRQKRRTYILRTLDLLRILTEIDKNPDAKIEIIRVKLNIPLGTFYNLITELKEKKLIYQPSGFNKAYILTDQARSIVPFKSSDFEAIYQNLIRISNILEAGFKTATYTDENGKVWKVHVRKKCARD